MTSITKWDIQRYKATRAKEISQNSGDIISPATVNRSLASLKKLFSYAVECGVAEKNPCNGVKLFKEKLGRVAYLEPDECRALIEATAPHVKPVVIALLHTGARRGEILSLDWRQVDMKRRQIILEESKTADTEPEYIPIDDTLYKTLREIGPKKSGPVFVNREGRQFRDIRTPLKTALEISGIAEARKKAGLPHVTVHTLRHTAASLLVMSGQPIQDVQKLLRHRDISTTQRYSHLSPSHMQNVAQALDKALSTVTKTVTEPKVLSFASAKKPL